MQQVKPKFDVGDRVRKKRGKRIFLIKGRMFPLNEDCGYLYALHKVWKGPEGWQTWCEEGDLEHAE